MLGIYRVEMVQSTRAAASAGVRAGIFGVLTAADALNRGSTCYRWSSRLALQSDLPGASRRAWVGGKCLVGAPVRAAANA